MRALSVRQPWAWLIFNAGKDVENRDWPTSVRGPVLIHASKGCTEDEWEEARDFSDPYLSGNLPEISDLRWGGIVGVVEIADCVRASDSPWFFGSYGFVLRNPRPLPFVPWRGQLGFFDVPEEQLSEEAFRALQEALWRRPAEWGETPRRHHLDRSVQGEK